MSKKVYIGIDGDSHDMIGPYDTVDEMMDAAGIDEEYILACQEDFVIYEARRVGVLQADGVQFVKDAK